MYYLWIGFMLGGMAGMWWILFLVKKNDLVGYHCNPKEEG